MRLGALFGDGQGLEAVDAAVSAPDGGDNEFAPPVRG